MTDNDTPHYTITQLAREFALTTRAIRFYEDQGLLTPERNGRTRVYNKADHTRLKLILRGKRLGFTLQEIRELFGLYDAARDEKPQAVKLLDYLHGKRSALEQQLHDIQSVLGEIDELERQCQELLER
ncbi:MerR family transcriptional regulator [Parachitinimonas caeni]|uniref:MerR family DNA-binding transcriptional regulator n=1 Tax=Parachitinimonas caeni TaxID=3031301 RepID=A0ABT7E0G8_9NEIS|nr:MerR family DNA-binding transcriptional regulator [Parachitinimonas caeni]MDK2125811.1 MerR family DNA-binding transcriptional regulator [Parachitinimonas caeni]